MITNGVNGVNVNVDVSWPVFVVDTLDTSTLTNNSKLPSLLFSVTCETFDSILSF